MDAKPYLLGPNIVIARPFASNSGIYQKNKKTDGLLIIVGKQLCIGVCTFILYPSRLLQQYTAIECLLYCYYRGPSLPPNDKNNECV